MMLSQFQVFFANLLLNTHPLSHSLHFTHSNNLQNYCHIASVYTFKYFTTSPGKQIDIREQIPLLSYHWFQKHLNLKKSLNAEQWERVYHFASHKSRLIMPLGC